MFARYFLSTCPIAILLQCKLKYRHHGSVMTFDSQVHHHHYFRGCSPIADCGVAW